MNFKFVNVFNSEKFFEAELKENEITILVGRNGHGKTSFLFSLEDWCKDNDYPVIYWSDSKYGRNNGMQSLLLQDRISELAGMAFHSEGEALFQAFASFFMGRAGSLVRKYANKDKKLFFLIDQLDSGLDVHQIDYIKNTIRNVIIPDVTKSNLTCFFVISANSYQTIYKEDSLDPVSGIHYNFVNLEQFKQFIESQYKDDEDDGYEED